MAERFLGLTHTLRRMIEKMGVSAKAAIGASTFIFLVLSVLGFCFNKDIPDNILYGFCMIWGGYTVNRTMKDRAPGGGGTVEKVDRPD